MKILMFAIAIFGLIACSNPATFSGTQSSQSSSQIQPTADNVIQFLATQPGCIEVDCPMPPTLCFYPNPQFDSKGCMNSCGSLTSCSGAGTSTPPPVCAPIDCAQPPPGYHYENSPIDANGCVVGCGNLVASQLFCPELECAQLPPPPGANYIWVPSNSYNEDGCKTGCGGSWVLNPVQCNPIDCAAPPEGMHYGDPDKDQNGCPVNCGGLIPNAGACPQFECAAIPARCSVINDPLPNGCYGGCGILSCDPINPIAPLNPALGQ